MPQSNIPSFLDWEKRKAKKPEREKGRFYEDFSFESFFKITPAWQSGKDYALIQIGSREFKLFEKNKKYLKSLSKYILQIFLYVDPKDYNNEMQDILNYVNENKKEFKEKWDRKLEVY